jgi:hypothetical protein
MLGREETMMEQRGCINWQQDGDSDIAFGGAKIELGR